MSQAIDIAKQALQNGDAVSAERHLRVLLARETRNAEALRLLGMAQSAQGRYGDAAGTLRSAADLDSNNALVFNSLGNALGRLGDKAGAATAFARACELAPQAAPFWYNLGKLLYEDARPEQALRALERAAALARDDLRAHFLLAQAQRVTGHTEAAAELYRQLLEGHPQRAEAWLGLASLQRLHFSAADVAAMEQTMRAELSEDDRISIRFALARGYEDQQRYADAFALYAQANALVRAHHAWDARHFSQRVDEFLGAFVAPLPPRGVDDQGGEVVFVVSMPRSGSSLAEQILASHPAVDGAGELQDLPAVLHEESERRGQPFPRWVGQATAADWRRLGQSYLERTVRWRAQRPRFTDKLPDNWRHVGAILRMLPAARIVICRRDPVETCLACFRQMFAVGGQAFSYDLDDLAAYWRDFDRAARHWARLYPDRVRTQQYEALLEDPEREVRDLLAFCDLPFDAACVRFHETRRSVQTASAAQVREPLRRDTARAPHYGALLDPLRRSLRLLSLQ